MQCVKVCPTAIDIRNGTQMECVGCTACIDACNKMMDAIGKPPGLIRYASENGIADHQPLRYTSRMKGYTVLLATLVVILGVLLVTRKDVDATVMRTPGMLYQERGLDSITNLYNIKIANKTTWNTALRLQLENMPGRIEVIGGHGIVLKQEEETAGTFFVVLPRQVLRERKLGIAIGLYDGKRRIDVIRTNFLGPVSEIQYRIQYTEFVVHKEYARRTESAIAASAVNIRQLCSTFASRGDFTLHAFD